ncbi:MAG: peptide/nickel transport system permease protein [Chlorobi bacterium OLB5]|nr:MAG: peptide/nickel transport system permease protein [Chlorobi bacterium OLB5]
MTKDKNKDKVSISIFRKRWRKFKTLKRGYYAFLVLVVLYGISFILPLFINHTAIMVKYNGSYYFPMFKSGIYESSFFGQEGFGEANYRRLKEAFSNAEGDNWVLMPLYPFSPNENLLDETEGSPPHPPSGKHWFGTDDRARDVFARTLYGFNISISFALVVTFFAYLIGVSIGSILGFFGGKVDIFGQRIIEIWSTLPFLYVMIIVSSILQPNFILLVFILTAFSWMGITYYVRGEFYREKARDYVSAAVSLGAKNKTIIFKHILPNSLTPIISFAPFAIVADISALVSLDFLGFGLPPPTPSWGQLVRQGMTNIEHWWLVAVPLAAMFLTLIAIVFIGEAIREAFDPKVYSRMR